jgi:hypothetical protein
MIKKTIPLPPRGGEEYSSYSFLTDTRWCEWSASRPSRTLPPGKPTVQEAEWASKSVWTQRLEQKSFVSACNRTPVIQSVVRNYIVRASALILGLWYRKYFRLITKLLEKFASILPPCVTTQITIQKFTAVKISNFAFIPFCRLQFLMLTDLCAAMGLGALDVAHLCSETPWVSFYFFVKSSC